MNETTLYAQTLEPFIEQMQELFDDEIQSAINCFDDVLYALFYVDKEVIPQERIQDMVYCIVHLQKSLKEANEDTTEEDKTSALPCAVTEGVDGD
jgi:hypothetical protein